LPLINCPECEKQISDKADACPHCGLPARWFGDSSTIMCNPIELLSSEVDFSKIRNSIISFDHAYQSAFSMNNYIAARELNSLKHSFKYASEALANKAVYEHCKDNASTLALDISLVNISLQRYESLNQDADVHNNRYIDDYIEKNKKYFDNLLKDIDPDIFLDNEQRRAVVADDDYCLIVAGAGAGKTTTMAAKVKYLVEKKGISPQDIIVISYTNKAIDELKERVNKKLKIPAQILTFHKFAYSLVKQYSEKPPDVNYSAYNIIFTILEKEIFHDNELLRNVLLFMGYYFDIPVDALDKYDSLDKYHLAKAAQEYETLKSGTGDYLKEIMRQRDKSMRTITGEFMRSVQETQIANFLYLNSIDYEYEPIYPHPIPGARKLYTPDFFIWQEDNFAYLEHYAVNESGYNYRFDEKTRIRYNRAIGNKRNLHARYNTKLLETWSGYKDGRSLLNHLQETLEAEGFILKERNFEEVYRKIVETSKDKYVYKMVQFLITFISQFKTCGYDEGGFDELRAKTKNPRTHLFLKIAETVYTYYQKALKEKNSIDFEDMINNAYIYIGEFAKQQINISYKYIIIDEFQDIARQRFNLTKRLSEVTKAKVIAVGDDWQSIFAFAGSEISLFTRFLDLMGSGIEMKITHTYRNAQELIDIAGKFIQNNPAQIEKELISAKSIKTPIILTEFDDSIKVNNAVAEAVERAIGDIINEFGIESSILLVGRYNFDGYKLCNTGKFSALQNDKIMSEKYPEADLTLMTAHRAKGLGFDNVIILNMFESKFGFPCQLEDDPIMKLVRYEDTSVPFAEERRLFYVALTRTKNRVFILAPLNKPSQFLIELINNYNIYHSGRINMEKVDYFYLRCPNCNYPLKYEFNKNYGLILWLCTNEPEICDFMTNNKTHLHDIWKCNSCEDGYMIVKVSKADKVFYGCTNYNDKGCNSSMKITE